MKEISDKWGKALRAVPIKKLFVRESGLKITSVTACTVAQFSIMKDGTIAEIHVRASEGPSSFQDVVLASLKDLRVESLPKNFPADHAEARIQFLVNAESPADFRTRLYDGSYGFVYARANAVEIPGVPPRPPH